MSAIDIPGYKIIKTLGVGGQATVYLAIQKGFDREVALKVMSPALAADPTFGKRFIREAKIVAKLSHRNIVTVYDAGECGSFYYLAMEYLPGKDLKTRIAGGLKAKESLRIIAKLAIALDFAHQKGYVHRDVKSENILFDGDDEPVLTDFGIAKASNASTQMTQTGKLIGTPEYMSPEQCRGKALDGRADLYSLGIIVFEMMTKEVPYSGEDSVSICIQHVTKPIPKLPARLLHFQWLVDLLLDKEASKRFQTGREVAKAIDSYLKQGRYEPGQSTKVMEKKAVVAKTNAPTVRRDDFEDETFEISDDYHIDQRINVQPEPKSSYKGVVITVLLVGLGTLGYVTKDKWYADTITKLGLEKYLPSAEYPQAASQNAPKKLPLNAEEKLGDEQKSDALSKQPSNKKNLRKTKSVASTNLKKSTSASELSDQTDTQKQNNHSASGTELDKLIQQADTLTQYDTHELADVRLALEYITTAKSMAPENKSVLEIRDKLIQISTKEAIKSAEKNLFSSAYDWVALVESVDRDNDSLSRTLETVNNLKRGFDRKKDEREQKILQIEQLIADGNKAILEKRLSAPEGDNAIYYFRKVDDLDAGNSAATDGLSRVAKQYLKLIDKALENKQFQRATRYSSQLKSLPSVGADFSAIDEKVFVAKRLFSQKQAEKKRLADIAEAKRKKEAERQAKLNDPLVQMRLQSSLETAKQLVEEGLLVEPIGNNALEKFKSALEIDSLSQEAIDGINNIEKTIVENIDVAISNNIANIASTWLNKLEVYNSNDPRIETYRTAIAGIENVAEASDSPQTTEDTHLVEDIEGIEDIKEHEGIDSIDGIELETVDTANNSEAADTADNSVENTSENGEGNMPTEPENKPPIP